MSGGRWQVLTVRYQLRNKPRRLSHGTRYSRAGGHDAGDGQAGQMLQTCRAYAMKPKTRPAHSFSGLCRKRQLVRMMAGKSFLDMRPVLLAGHQRQRPSTLTSACRMPGSQTIAQSLEDSKMRSLAQPAQPGSPFLTGSAAAYSSDLVGGMSVLWAMP